jgi:putative selenate reductase
MPALYPVPFGRLVSRMFRELERAGSIFDLPARHFFRGHKTHDYSVAFHGRTASTPLGPAAGPHSQLAQNIVLSFLAGARILELKTVQIMDELVIPRPCIDASTVGYNVEWSQELLLEQSLEEYVKGSMLIEMLVASGVLGLAAKDARVLFDMSVGYDLAGIKSERVTAFIRGMKDARAVVDELRAEIPAEHARYRDLPFKTSLSDTLTLSTFHGCPPDEIERIVQHLLEVESLHCIVKCNPTLLGPAEARRVYHDALGYTQRIPDEAFDRDAKWPDVVAMMERLDAIAKRVGRGLGVKFSNTLIVENDKAFFPKTEKVMYLSGKPLHVLAMCLVDRFRGTFGDRFPISFSAGIDRHNFADAAALGLVPVTVCTDLLRAGGYARARHYFEELDARMEACSVTTMAGLDAHGGGHAEAAKRYVESLLADPRYKSDANQKSPPKVGSKLWLFDCLTCDKCIPVCPNDANFVYPLPKVEIPVVKLHKLAGGGFRREEDAALKVDKKHQIATFADLCNECGNCDVFCPEDGGPYVLKPRFFGSERAFLDGGEKAAKDGVFVDTASSTGKVLGRFRGATFSVQAAGERVAFSGPGFDVSFEASSPEETVEGRVDEGATIDLTVYRILDWLKKGALDPSRVHYVNT